MMTQIHEHDASCLGASGQQAAVLIISHVLWASVLPSKLDETLSCVLDGLQFDVGVGV